MLDRAEVASQFSRYVQRLLHARPDLSEELQHAHQARWGTESMRAFVEAQGICDEASLDRALRALRQRVMLWLAARDLGGRADLQEVFAAMTALADVSITTAHSYHHGWLAQRHGEPFGEESKRAQALIVVAMGKLGGGELNVSSDIDLIFVYGEEGQTRGEPGAQTAGGSLSNHEFFTLLGKRIIATLGASNADGFVFRVDMRLRPYGDSGPLVASLAMLEDYFFTQARAWERYAWAKARTVTGASHDLAALASLVRPFVFRRYLDFVALENLRDMHRQVREEVKRRDRENDIKLGPGGIREIEFIAQVFQLIRGGRDTSLQTRATIATLQLLAEKSLLPAGTVAELLDAYRFLRALEHRLQYRDDAQTQRLPSDANELSLIALSMGFSEPEQFSAVLNGHRARVTLHFDGVFAEQKNNGTATADLLQGNQSAAHIEALGYDNAPEVMRRIDAIRDSARYRQLPDSSRAKAEKLLPEMVRAAAKQSHPLVALSRMLDLFEAISRREAYLALLIEYPQTLERVAALAGWSPWALKYLQQHPILLDELLDPRQFGREPHWRELARSLDANLAQVEGDAEQQMDLLRHFKQAQLFHLIAQDFAGTLTVERLSDHLSELADLMLGRTLNLVWSTLPKRHCPSPRFAVVGFGKLGGKELGYGSDLDIVFLYDDAAGEAPENYARLAQRLNAWLNAYTGAGVLYQTDLRLRPDGASGLLVSPLSAFAEYQQKQAWVWEHQALTRARFCAGDAGIGAAFEALRVQVLRQRRDLATLRTEVLAMREKMRAEHRPPKDAFDVKADAGGLIDVEFAVQYLVLGHAHKHEALTRNSGNIALLQAAADLGLLPGALAVGAADAYRALRRLQHQTWLNEMAQARVAHEVARPHAQAVKALWRAVFGE